MSKIADLFLVWLFGEVIFSVVGQRSDLLPYWLFTNLQSWFFILLA